MRRKSKNRRKNRCFELFFEELDFLGSLSLRDILSSLCMNNASFDFNAYLHFVNI